MGLWDIISEKLGFGKRRLNGASSNEDPKAKREGLIARIKSGGDYVPQSVKDVVGEILVNMGANPNIAHNPHVVDKIPLRKLLQQTGKDNHPLSLNEMKELSEKFPRLSDEELMQDYWNNYDAMINLSSKLGIEIDPKTRNITIREVTGMMTETKEFWFWIKESKYSLDEQGNVISEMTEYKMDDKGKQNEFHDLSLYDKYGLEWKKVVEEFDNKGVCRFKVVWERDSLWPCCVSETVEKGTASDLPRNWKDCIEKGFGRMLSPVIRDAVSRNEFCEEGTTVYRLLCPGSSAYLPEDMIDGYKQGTRFQTRSDMESYCVKNQKEVAEILFCEEPRIRDHTCPMMNPDQQRGLIEYAKQLKIVAPSQGAR